MVQFISITIYFCMKVYVHFFLTEDVEHIFMCLVGTVTSSFYEVSIELFCTLKTISYLLLIIYL